MSLSYEMAFSYRTDGIQKATMGRRLIDTVSLDALRVFDSCARHMNFTKAAREFSVSQAAISRRIKNLERHIGIELFQRDGRKVSLTPKGRVLFRRVQMSLGYLGSELETIRDDARRFVRTVMLHGPPQFTHLWLCPRLIDFARACPDIQLRVYTSHEMLELRSAEDDLVILYSAEDVPDWQLTPLVREELVPAAAPRYLESMGLAAMAESLPPAQLSKLDLLDTHRSNVHSVTLGDWFARTLGEDAVCQPRIVYPNYSAAVEAALEGHGVALGCRGMLAHHFATGRLVPLSKEGFDTGYGYHLGFPKGVPLGEGASRLARFLVDLSSPTEPSPKGRMKPVPETG